MCVMSPTVCDTSRDVKVFLEQGMSFYAVLKKITHKKGQPDESQAALAAKLDVNQSTLRGWRHVAPTALSIERVALKLDMKPGRLFEEYLKDLHSNNGGQG